jgi:hypothetical protein
MFGHNLLVVWLISAAALLSFVGEVQAGKPTEGAVVPPSFPAGLSIEQGKLTLPQGWKILNWPASLDANVQFKLIPFDPEKSVDGKLAGSTILLSATQADGFPVGVCRYEVGKNQLVYVPFYSSPREKGQFSTWRTIDAIDGTRKIAIDYVDGKRPSYYVSQWFSRQEKLRCVIPPTPEENKKRHDESLARAMMSKGKGIPESPESIARRQKVFEELKKKDEAAKQAPAVAGSQD